MIFFFFNWQSRLKVFEDVNGSGFEQTFPHSASEIAYFVVCLWSFSSSIFIFSSDSWDRPPVTRSQVEKKNIWRAKFYKNKVGQRKGNS